MSTKNLARTVIEGGQRWRNKIERRVSTRSLRADTRAFLSAVRHDPEGAEGIAPPSRASAQVAFADKLNPAYRFLDSRVGKGWNNTLALLAERFDPRTIPGRHVVHDHILRDVAPSREAVGTNGRGTELYYVDARGILRNGPRHRFHRHQRPVVFDREAVLKWLDGRQVGRVGSRLFWFVAARDAALIRMIARPNRLAVEYVLEGAHPGDPPPAFRQARPLARADAAYFEALDTKVKDAILRCAPTSSSPQRPRQKNARPWAEIRRPRAEQGKR
jgi:hypothetical protein